MRIQISAPVRQEVGDGFLMARKLVGRSGSTGSHQVIFKGDLTIRSIAQAHARLRDALQAHASLTVGVAEPGVGLCDRTDREVTLEDDLVRSGRARSAD